MRNAFIEELVVLARENPQIALIVGDLGYSVIEPFADEFPERFINAGVAEQNMTGLAAGIASEGYHVFTYSIANFPTFRCAEQIRNDVAYHKFPVTIVSVGGGLAYGALGYSHHAVQDYALLRTLPNMLIAAPGDPMEVRACMRFLVANPQPSYLRLAKAGEPNFHETIPHVSPGLWLYHGQSCNSSTDLTLLTTGATLAYAMDKLKRGLCNKVFSLPIWGQNVKQAQVAQVAELSNIETVEDHLIDGGFGSWLLEALVANSNDISTKLNIRALDPSVCGTVGKQETLNRFGGL
jgi:transketolase